MAQHDMNIENQGFPGFRADLNNALGALVSNNSGATAPATTFAHQYWVDTSANPSVLKIRNADNDAFITIGTINQTADTFTLTSLVAATGGSINNTTVGATTPAAGSFTTLNTSGQVVLQDASGATRVTVTNTANAAAGAGINFIVKNGGTTVGNGTIRTDNSDNLSFFNIVGERMRITSGGVLLVGKEATSINASGVELDSSGAGLFTVSADTVMYVNRTTNDGTLIELRQANAIEGTISVSGNTVSYNAFTGGHWSQLQEGRGYNPDIPRGTVMSTIGEMCEWKSVEWTETTEHPAIAAVEAKEVVLDEEGDVIEPAVEAVEGKDAWAETSDKREAYLGQLPVGAIFEEDGFTKTVIDDGNERLPKVKISDVVGDKAVYGVFQTWDEVEDMLVTSLGAFVVRIAAGVTVEIGDLLESNGDGCAKVQDDDVIRSKTIAKVTSTNPTATYDDGSYTVPAVIYCG